MGGQDKGWVPWQGQALVQHVIERLAPQVDRILINCNRNQARYAALGYPVVSDKYANFQGPLAGVAALLAHTTTDWLAIAPCDGPLLPLDLVSKLHAAACESNASIAVAQSPEHIQPMYALIHSNLASSLEAFLCLGQRKPMQWYQQQALVCVKFDSAENAQVDAFFNINRLAQLD